MINLFKKEYSNLNKLLSSKEFLKLDLSTQGIYFHLLWQMMFQQKQNYLFNIEDIVPICNAESSDIEQLLGDNFIYKFKTAKIAEMSVYFITTDLEHKKIISNIKYNLKNCSSPEIAYEYEKNIVCALLRS